MLLVPFEVGWMDRIPAMRRVDVRPAIVSGSHSLGCIFDAGFCSWEGIRYWAGERLSESSPNGGGVERAPRMQAPRVYLSTVQHRQF